MKTRLLWLLPLMACSCLDNPADTEQYMKTIYFAGAHDETRLHEIDIDYDTTVTATFVSVICSGSLMPEHDVVVDIDVDEEGVNTYNDRYHPNGIDPDNILEAMKTEYYNIPDKRGIIRKGGDCYVRIPILVETEKISREAKVVIPLKIVAASDYIIKKDNSHILLKFNFHNAYSGEYRLEAIRTNLNTNEEQTVIAIRQVDALNHNTVRLFPGLSVEDRTKTDANALTFCFENKNRVKVSAYKDLEISDSEHCTYDPIKKIIHVLYDYKDPDDGNMYRIEGGYYFL